MMKIVVFALMLLAVLWFYSSGKEMFMGAGRLAEQEMEDSYERTDEMIGAVEAANSLD